MCSKLLLYLVMQTNARRCYIACMRKYVGLPRNEIKIHRCKVKSTRSCSSAVHFIVLILFFCALYIFHLVLCNVFFSVLSGFNFLRFGGFASCARWKMFHVYIEYTCRWLLSAENIFFLVTMLIPNGCFSEHNEGGGKKNVRKWRKRIDDNPFRRRFFFRCQSVGFPFSVTLSTKTRWRRKWRERKTTARTTSNLMAKVNEEITWEMKMTSKRMNLRSISENIQRREIIMLLLNAKRCAFCATIQKFQIFKHVWQLISIQTRANSYIVVRPLCLGIWIRVENNQDRSALIH